MAPPRRRGAPGRAGLVLAVLLAVLASSAVGCGSGDQAGGRRAGTSPTDASRAPATTATGDPSGAGAPAAAAVPWTHARAVHWLLTRRVRVPGTGRSVALDGATLTCVGVGRAVRVSGRPAWTRFRCVQPTFPKGAVVGPDVLFVARSTGPRTLSIEDVRRSRY